ASFAPAPLAAVLEYLALTKHLLYFAKGVVDTRDLVFYLCFIFFFLFLTLRSLESKRWRG
ncbi:MAG: ABC transporter permease, partial [Thermodesulfobacteriota bacterium]